MRNSSRSSEVKNLVVRIPNWIGDAVFSVPAIRTLASRFPEARVTLLGPEGPVTLLGEIAGVDETLALDPSSYSQRWTQSWRLRRRHPELGFVLPESFSSALELRAAGVRTRVGRPTQGRRFLLSHCVSYGAAPRSRHVVDEYLELAGAVGAVPQETDPRLEPAHEAQRTASRIMPQQSGGVCLGIIPGAVYGPAKRWPLERYAALARCFRDARVVVFGSRAERDVGESIASRIQNPTLILAGRTTVPVLAACLARCSLVVGNDTGPTHLAAAVGVPVVGVYGSTSSVWTGLRGSRCRIVKASAECAPCYLRQCNRNSFCLEGVSVEEVWEACRGLLEDTSTGVDGGELSTRRIVDNGR